MLLGCFAVHIYLILMTINYVSSGLTTDMRLMQTQYYAPNSCMTRNMQVQTYMRFIDSFEGLLAPTPCDSKQVALYITWLSKLLKIISIKNYLSALNHFLKSEDYSY